MATKREKEIIHQPDLLMQAFDTVSMYIRENTKQFLYGVATLVIIIAAVGSYLVYSHYRDQKIQYELAQGIIAMQSYAQTRSAGDIDKAEGIFQKISDKTSGKTRYLSKLYLANINLARGKKDEALKLYQDVSKNSSNQSMTYLADKAISSIDKK